MAHSAGLENQEAEYCYVSCYFSVLLRCNPYRHAWILFTRIIVGELATEMHGREESQVNVLAGIRSRITTAYPDHHAVLVPIMGVSGIIAGTVFMHMVGFAHLWWFSFFFTKQRKAS